MRSGNAIEQLGDFLVAAIAADHGAIDFKQLGRLAKNFGDVFVFHVIVAADVPDPRIFLSRTIIDVRGFSHVQTC